MIFAAGNGVFALLVARPFADDSFVYDWSFTVIMRPLYHDSFVYNRTFTVIMVNYFLGRAVVTTVVVMVMNFALTFVLMLDALMMSRSIITMFGAVIIALVVSVVALITAFIVSGKYRGCCNESANAQY